MRLFLILSILMLVAYPADAMRRLSSDAYDFVLFNSGHQVICTEKKTGLKKILIRGAAWGRFATDDSTLYVSYTPKFNPIRKLTRIDLKTLKILDEQECTFEDLAIYQGKIYYVNPDGNLCWKKLTPNCDLNNEPEYPLCPANMYALFELSGDNLFVISEWDYKFIDLKNHSLLESFNRGGLTFRDSNSTDYLAKDLFHVYLIDKKAGNIRDTFYTISRIKDAGIYDSTIFVFCVNCFMTIDPATRKTTLREIPEEEIKSFLILLCQDRHIYGFSEGGSMKVYDLKTLKTVLSIYPFGKECNYYDISTSTTDLMQKNKPFYPLFPTKKKFRDVWNQRRLTTFARACPKAFLYDQEVNMPKAIDTDFDKLIDLLLTAPSLVINTIFDEMTPDLVLVVLMHHKSHHTYFSSIEWKYRRPTLFHHLCYRLWHQDCEGAQRLLIPLLILKDPLAEELYRYSLGFGITEVGIGAFLKNQIAQMAIVSKPKPAELILRGPQLAEPHVNIDGNASEKK